MADDGWVASKDESAYLPIWVRADSGGRRLSRPSIVDAAIDLADARGLDAVTVRALAGAIGVRPMSLYHHIDGKDDLLDLMFDELAGRNLLGDAMPSGWREALQAIAHRVREVGLAHPWSVEILARRAPLGPNTLRLLDEWVCAVRELDLPAASAWSVVTALNDYVVGYVVREAAQRSAVPAKPDAAAAWRHAVNDYLAGQTANYPHLAPLMAEGFAGTPDNFAAGLDAFLDAVAARHA